MSTLSSETPSYKKISFNLLSVGLIVLLLYVGQGILLPLFFAVLLSTLLLPVNNFLERKGLHRVFAIVLSLIFAFTIIGIVIYFLVHQLANFLDDLPTIQERLDNMITVLQKWIRSTFSITIRAQNKYLNDTTLKMKESGGEIVQQTIVTLTQVLSYLVLLPIYTFLILYYRTMIRRFLIALFKNSTEENVNEILHESQNVSQSYIAGLMIELSLVFALNAAGFLLLGIKYALFLALVAALLNLIPYVGMITANLFCMLITLISCEIVDLGDVLWVGVVLAVVQFFDNNFFMPLIVGSKVRINSLATIVGVLVGGALCGIPGMFLSIPGLAVLKVIFDRAEGLKPFGMLLGDDSPPRQVLKAKGISSKKII